jgi:hypothetical protein
MAYSSMDNMVRIDSQPQFVQRWATSKDGDRLISRVSEHIGVKTR